MSGKAEQQERKWGRQLKGHGISGYWEDADFEKAYRMLASHASHSTWNSWAEESTSESYRVFTWLTPWKGGWIPLFTFSLSTPATTGCTCGWESTHIYFSQSRWKGSGQEAAFLQ